MWEESGDQVQSRFLSPPLNPCNLPNLCVFVCVYAGLFCSDLPLNTIREPRTVVGGGGVVSSHGVQEVVVCRYAHSSSPLGHGCTHAPLVGVRIKALHRPEARAAVTTSHCKQSGKKKERITKWVKINVRQPNMCMRWVDTPDLAGGAPNSCQMLMWDVMTEQWQRDSADTAASHG